MHKRTYAHKHGCASTTLRHTPTRCYWDSQSMHKYAYTYIYTCIYMHTYTYTYIHAYTYIYTCLYIYIHTHMYTHTYDMYIAHVHMDRSTKNAGSTKNAFPQTRNISVPVRSRSRTDAKRERHITVVVTSSDKLRWVRMALTMLPVEPFLTIATTTGQRNSRWNLHRFPREAKSLKRLVWLVLQDSETQGQRDSSWCGDLNYDKRTSSQADVHLRSYKLSEHHKQDWFFPSVFSGLTAWWTSATIIKLTSDPYKWGPSISIANASIDYMFV